MRKAWFYWQGRVGAPYWNMQYAFRGHLVVLCDERTGSDGEAFTEGFKRLGLGKVIGTRTWGGEIWLSFDNRLVDKGIASAAEYGVYGPEGKWLIEGHGVDPDMVVDNAPHATFGGEDSQLKKAIDYLQEEIRQRPVTVPRRRRILISHSNRTPRATQIGGRIRPGRLSSLWSIPWRPGDSQRQARSSATRAGRGSPPVSRVSGPDRRASSGSARHSSDPRLRAVFAGE